MTDTPREREPRDGAAQPTRTPGLAHRALGAFVGRWRTEGEIDPGDGRPVERLVASDSYEWLAGGFFLEHRVEGRLGEHEVRTLEVIGYDEARGVYFTHAYDNAGNSEHYEARLDGRRWTITGATVRFAGAFGDDGRTLAGTWERSDDGAAWRHWMTIRLTRTGAR